MEPTRDAHSTSPTGDSAVGLDVVSALWKWKYPILGLTIVFAVVGFLLAYMKKPSFTCESVLYLGGKAEGVYTDPRNSKFIITSEDFLKEVTRQDPSLSSVQNLRKMVDASPVNETAVKFTVRAQDPDLAQKVCTAVAHTYLLRAKDEVERSLENLQSTKEALAQLQAEVAKSLERNREALRNLETSGTGGVERELALARLSEYVVREESLLLNLLGRIQEIDRKLGGAMRPEILETSPPLSASSGGSKAYAGAGAIFGFFLGVFLALAVEIRRYLGA